MTTVRLRVVIRAAAASIVLIAGGAAGFVAWLSAGPRSAVDFGKYRAIVIQSDDWGFEGWFPDVQAATALPGLWEDLPPWLVTYAKSTLESPDDLAELGQLLQSVQDLDGLPAILQANYIVAGPDLEATRNRSAPWGWPVHASGDSSGRYARPGLRQAETDWIARGVWRPELHGLTHFDLFRYAAARDEGDEFAVESALHDVFAYQGWTTGSELDDRDPSRARSVAREAVRRFQRRFGRSPVSVIAPDYRWGREDEAAWRSVGLRIVQAKEEQVDAALAPYDWRARLRKWWRRSWDLRSTGLYYMRRDADLEPYGDATGAAVQGAEAAVAAVQAAWDDGRPGVISIHRAQLVSFDRRIEDAGRTHLLRCLEILAEGGMRVLVDAEVAQLDRQGWSVLQRGSGWVVRNWTASALEIPDPRTGTLQEFSPGTHRLDLHATVLEAE